MKHELPRNPRDWHPIRSFAPGTLLSINSPNDCSWGIVISCVHDHCSIMWSDGDWSSHRVDKGQVEFCLTFTVLYDSHA
jgi:hypothetical protein